MDRDRVRGEKAGGRMYGMEVRRMTRRRGQVDIAKE